MKKAAFFDVDNTLVRGNVSILYAKLYRKIGMIPLRSMLRISYLAFLHKMNFLTYEKLAKTMLSFLKGMDVKTEKDRVKQNFGIVRERIYTDIEKELRKKKKSGYSIILLTNAIGRLIEPLAEHLGADNVISSRLDEKDGKLTGEVMDICYGENKKLLLAKYCKKNKISIKDSYFYSDSSSDLPTLKYIGHPVAVNPDRKLRRYAKEHRWDILD